MTIRMRTAFLIALGVVLVWFLYIERAILNPLISFLTEKLKINRSFAAAIVFLLIIFIVSFSIFVLTRQIIAEWDDLTRTSADIISQTRQQVYILPLWAQQAYLDTIQSLE